MKNNSKGNEQQNTIAKESNNSNFPINNTNSNNNLGIYQNYNANQNSHVTSLIKFCIKLSISYIAIWSLVVIFTIMAALCSESFYDLFGSVYGIGYTVSYVCNYLGLSLAAALSVALFVIGIILIVKVNSLKDYYPSQEYLWIWFLVGLFLFGIFSSVGSILTISSCKEIQAKNTYNLQG